MLIVCKSDMVKVELSMKVSLLTFWSICGLTLTYDQKLLIEMIFIQRVSRLFLRERVRSSVMQERVHLKRSQLRRVGCLTVILSHTF